MKAEALPGSYEKGTILNLHKTKTDKNMKTGKMILSLVAGIAAGAAVGAAFGILYAPDKGTETRRKISQRGEELKDNLKHKFENVKGEAHDLLDKGKSKIYEAKNDVTTNSSSI